MFCIDASALKCKLRLLALALVTSLRDVTLIDASAFKEFCYETYEKFMLLICLFLHQWQ